MNTKTEDFQPHRNEYTIVYNFQGEEIARLDGIVSIRPKDFEDQLPIQYRHVTVTTETLNIVHIEKQIY